MERAIRDQAGWWDRVEQFMRDYGAKVLIADERAYIRRSQTDDEPEWPDDPHACAAIGPTPSSTSTPRTIDRRDRRGD